MSEPIEMRYIEIPTNRSMVRPVVERRLDFAHKAMGQEPGSFIRFDDSGYAALEELTGGNPGFTLYAVSRVFDRYVQNLPEDAQPPHVVTGDDVRQTGVSREAWEAWDDMGKPTIISMPRRSD